MEALIWIGRVMFAALAVMGVVRTIYLNREFQHHLRQHHSQEWKTIYEDQILKKSLLWPLMRGTPVDFLWTSREDFGDQRISDLRTRIRRSFIGTFSAGVATVVWWFITQVLLDTTRP